MFGPREHGQSVAECHEPLVALRRISMSAHHSTLESTTLSLTPTPTHSFIRSFVRPADRAFLRIVYSVLESPFSFSSGRRLRAFIRLLL